MKKIIYLFLMSGLGLLIINNSSAQISQGGKPFSFYAQNAANLKSKIPTSIMPFVDVAALKQEDLIVDKIKDIPWRFGENIDVILNSTNSGITEILPNGDKLWRLRIYSQGAQSINLTFDNYRLPAGAKLFVYNDDHTDVIGAFTDFNNQENRIFATTLVRGDAVTLEYYEPANVAFTGELNISKVTHGYRGPYDYLKGLNTSGGCQINVKCPTGLGWENQISSVCMLVTGGSGFCTGALVNNTANDGTPYVLTANHCYSDPTSWVFWFNWQSPTCTNPGSDPGYNSISGATLKAKNATSDFCLVQISSTPPSNFNIYYSGWDHSGTAPTSGMGIHHPDGDIKKISPCSAMTSTTYSSVQAWETPWSTAACTEPGSSGSPMFDQNKRIVGQLYGGPSACGETAANMRDYYGRFDLSWTGGGTSSTRLSNWLDPSSTGVAILDGYNPNGAMAPTADFTSNISGGCSGTVSFTDLSSYSPNNWLWNFGDGDTSTLQNPTHSYTSNGPFSVKLKVTNSVGSDSITKSDYISLNMPESPVALGDTVCNPASAHLTATGNGFLRWFDSPSGTNVLQTGNYYDTPILTTTTNYYVNDSIVGATAAGGKTDSIGGGSMFTNTQVHYEIFNCSIPLVLQTVKIYANAAQTNKVITLQNSSGATLATATVNLNLGINTVTLNFDLPVATGLRLAGPGSPGWYRNTAGFTYPLDVPGKISITGSSAGTTLRYYYFYDWSLKEKDCVSGRTIVTATVKDCSAGIESLKNLNISISPNPVSTQLNVDFSGITENNIKIEIYDLIGQKVYSQAIEDNSGTFRKPIDVSSFLNGIYFIRISTEQFQKTYKFIKN